jgi:D-tyrosyl-tRNA(Tyr) deacylase
MRAVVQRVSQASVTVDERMVGRIGPGLMVLLGVEMGDTDDDLAFIVKKLAELRIFVDDDGKMNRSVADIDGAVLLISQFTLLGDARKGRRPTWIAAAPGEVSEPVYESFCTALRGLGATVAEGSFGADMQVASVNDGPVTVLLETP